MGKDAAATARYLPRVNILALSTSRRHTQSLGLLPALSQALRVPFALDALFRRLASLFALACAAVDDGWRDEGGDGGG